MSTEHADVALIGAGIMSATLGTWLKHLEPGLSIVAIERMDRAATESSDAWNNAGTGHSAFCELNYTPETDDGRIPIEKACKIASSFEISKQFWASLAERGVLTDPHRFVNAIPHCSFVRGTRGVDYLQRRYQALRASPLFEGMRYSEDPHALALWMPLMMEGRDRNEPVAATFMGLGTDVNFGALTRDLCAHLDKSGVPLHFHREVIALERDTARDGAGWVIASRDLDDNSEHTLHAKFVFIGAGGGALPLLLKSGIPEAQGYGGFPISGQWLVCRKPEVIEHHYAKVYGQAAVGAPPMSVPHLDTRIINGQQALLFGPFAGFSTKFLKHGSLLDLPASLRANNVVPMLSAGLDNLTLTRYLIQQVAQTAEDRLATLRGFVPTARLDEWELEVAGQRVQVIKHDEEHGGVLEFGTEVVACKDGSIAALLGASPGASTAVAIQLDVLKKCFPTRFASPEWQARIRELVPSYGSDLGKDRALLRQVRHRTAEILQIAAE